MKKQTRFRVGDEVYWPGGPNEFGNNRSGKILSIKKGVAIIDDGIRSATKTRKVPLKILLKSK